MLLRLAQQVLWALLCTVAFQQATDAQATAPPPVPETSSVSGCPQSSPVDEAKASNEREISVAELTFEGDLRLPYTDQEQIASELRQIAYRGNSERVADELLERIRRASQDRGYFKVSVHGDSRILTSSPVNERIAVHTHLIEGPQYRLAEITFEHGKAISNLRALRNLFPIEDGDIFSRQKIAEGLDNLRKAYGQLGHINFTAVPDAETNDERRLIYLGIELDEGKQFYVSSVNILGVDESARQALLLDFLLKPGNVFNSRFVDLFWKSHPSLQASPSSQTNLRLDERMATVAITLNLRGCPVD